MKKLHELLQQKEQAIKRLEKDIEAIRTVLNMLTEEPEPATTEDAKPPAGAPSGIAMNTKPAGGTYSAVSQNALVDVPKITPRWP